MMMGSELYSRRKEITAMTDCMKLNNLIEDSGITITAICSKMGITRKSLYNKINGKTEFKVSELYALSKILHMSSEDRDSIFFADSVN